jgi:ABC-type Zn uptake system ZnuABC Zn-binding protein ZnuA
MGDREDAKRLRQQAQELLDAAQCKEMRADEEERAAAAERELEARLPTPSEEALRYVGRGYIRSEAITVPVHPRDNELTEKIVVDIIEKAREDGARRQRALIRQEAECAEDAGDFVRWAMELK